MPLLERRFEADFRDVGSARLAVALALSEHGLSWLTDDAATVVSELATNAVLHARTGFRVVVSLAQGRLRVSVYDGSASLPRRRRGGDLGSTTGRGLLMVAALSAAWGTSPTPGGGKETWCEFDLARTALDLTGRQEAARPAGPAGVERTGGVPVDVETLLSSFDDDGPWTTEARLPDRSRHRVPVRA